MDQDVPIVITENFKPAEVLPPVITSQPPNPSYSILEEYDFATEHLVKMKMAEWRTRMKMEEEDIKLRVQCILEQESALRLVEEKEYVAECDKRLLETGKFSYANWKELPALKKDNFPNLKNEFNSLSISSEVPSDKREIRNFYSQPSASVDSTALRMGSILPPVRYTPEKVEVKETKALLDLKDFECDTSTPFDSTELKSINDRAELINVLRPQITPFSWKQA